MADAGPAPQPLDNESFILETLLNMQRDIDQLRYAKLDGREVDAIGGALKSQVDDAVAAQQQVIQRVEQNSARFGTVVALLALLLMVVVSFASFMVVSQLTEERFDSWLAQKGEARLLATVENGDGAVQKALSQRVALSAQSVALQLQGQVESGELLVKTVKEAVLEVADQNRMANSYIGRLEGLNANGGQLFASFERQLAQITAEVRLAQDFADANVRLLFLNPAAVAQARRHPVLEDDPAMWALVEGYDKRLPARVLYQHYIDAISADKGDDIESGFSESGGRALVPLPQEAEPFDLEALANKYSGLDGAE